MTPEILRRHPDPERSEGEGPLYLFVLRIAALFLSLTLVPAPLHAQGCAQCRDNTAATTPATQRAYRRAILLMSGAGATFFLATVALFKRNP
jgi:hypothetical protein